MKNPAALSAAAVIAVGLLAGCSSTTPVAAGQSASSTPSPSLSVPPAASPTPTPTPTATPKTNDRGQLIKQVGESGGYTDGSMRFTVTSIQPVTCDAPYAPKPHGTALAVAIEVKTTAAFKGPLVQDGTTNGISFSPNWWKGYAANGTRMNTVDTGINEDCLADRTRLLPSFISKGESATGVVILDVTSPTGSIAFDEGGAAWTWDYPSK